MGLVAAVAKNLPSSDVWCILYPAIRPMLHSDVKEMDEAALMSALLPPVSTGTLSIFKQKMWTETDVSYSWREAL